MQPSYPGSIVRCALVGAVVYSSGSVDGADNPSVADAIDLLESAANSIKSYDLEITATHRLLKKDLTRQRRYRQMFEGGKRRFEIANISDGKPALRQVLVFDGKSLRVRDPDHKRGNVLPPPEAFCEQHEDYATVFSTVLGTITMPAMLRGRDGNSAYRDPLRDNNIVIDSPAQARPLPYGDSGFKIWLDAKHGNLPVVVEEFVRAGPGDRALFRRTEVLEFVPLADGKWAPLEARTTWFSWRVGPTRGMPHSDVTLVVDRQRSSWNVPLDAKVFSLEFPSGTLVGDRVRGKFYTAGGAADSNDPSE